VDLIAKLNSDYNLKLVYTQDGQTYMTPQYIVDQLRDMIILKGKTNTQELAN